MATLTEFAELSLTRAELLLLKNGLLELVFYWPQEVERVTGRQFDSAKAVNVALRDELHRHDEQGPGGVGLSRPVTVLSGPRVGGERGAARRVYLSPERHDVRIQADLLDVHLRALAFVAAEFNERDVDARLGSTKRDIADFIADLARPGSFRRPA